MVAACALHGEAIPGIAPYLSVPDTLYNKVYVGSQPDESVPLVHQERAFSSPIRHPTYYARGSINRFPVVGSG